MSPRRSVAEAEATRAAIVERAVELASTDGLEGLTIGRLAGDLDMSKAGVLGHFGTKEQLQLATLEAAIAVFRREVWEPAVGEQPGLPRLMAVCDAWLSYLEAGTFPGGCFLTAASCEFDGRGGPVRDAVAQTLDLWRQVLQNEVRAGIEAGDLDQGLDPAAVAFQLNALAMGTNQSVQLFGERAAVERARRAMHAVLGLPLGN